MIHLVDSLHLGKPHVICVALVKAAQNEWVMIDSGPESVFDSVVAGIKKLGLKPENVRHLLGSHIHLDHTGGAWRWAKEFGTQVYAHPKGVPHLIDPEKLVASATRIYGDKMQYLWGNIDSIVPELVTAVDDGALLSIGDAEFRTLYTPGHAQHHNAYFLENEKALFAGDVVGVTIDGGPSIPPFPPPDIHLESWKQSLDKIRLLFPSSLYVTHFGKIDSPIKLIDEFEQRLFSWADWVKRRLLEGKSESEIVPEFQAFTEQSLRAAGLNAQQLSTYEQADPAAMSVAGLSRYWKKYHPRQAPIERS
jgi:glyoxylase-like metal-dependent hydrolase (beta-lactamase superfamily II)